MNVHLWTCVLGMNTHVCNTKHNQDCIVWMHTCVWKDVQLNLARERRRIWSQLEDWNLKVFPSGHLVTTSFESVNTQKIIPVSLFHWQVH